MKKSFAAFAGILVAGVLGCTGATEEQPASTTDVTADAEEYIPVVFTDPTTVEISVPEMMCPHGCYPGVKKALLAQPNVESVELGTPAEAEKDEINDRRVIVKTSGKFNVTDAVAAIPSHLQKGVEAQEIEIAAVETQEAPQEADAPAATDDSAATEAEGGQQG